MPTQSAVVTYVAAQILNALPSQTSNSGKYLTTNGTTTSWGTVSANPQFTVKTSNYTAVANDALMCDTSSGSFTITLPATPSVNTYVRVDDYAGKFNQFNLTIARNGQIIMGYTEDLIVTNSNASVTLVYSGATYGWRIV